MQKVTLYRYTRTEGGVTVSPVKPEGEFTELYRLIADEGMELTDGVNRTTCTDTADPSAWTEVAVDGEEATDPDLATVEDYEAALAAFGVEV